MCQLSNPLTTNVCKLSLTHHNFYHLIFTKEKITKMSPEFRQNVHFIYLFISVWHIQFIGLIIA